MLNEFNSWLWLAGIIWDVKVIGDNVGVEFFVE